MLNQGLIPAKWAALTPDRQAVFDVPNDRRITFSELDVRLLPGAGGELRYAVVTGRFHLDRATHGEVAQDDGVFSLLWEKTADGWKIILDHTS